MTDVPLHFEDLCSHTCLPHLKFLARQTTYFHRIGCNDGFRALLEDHVVLLPQILELFFQHDLVHRCICVAVSDSVPTPIKRDLP